MLIKKTIFLLSLTSLFFFSCNSSVNKIFTKKTAHEAYGSSVDDSAEGQQWLAVSKTTLLAAQPVTLPYRMAGYFPTDKPRALSLQFSAKQGEQINFDLIKKAGTNFVVYADLFIKDDLNVSHLLAADTANSQFNFNIPSTGIYMLRLQPELYRTGEYDFSISLAPSLGFPVAGKKASIESFWGADRDAGKRSHEGIDIFATKRTPAVAAADGYISRVADGGIGGKTIWLKPSDQPVHLYYAHLDTQFVKEGQDVKQGDTLGLIGNTGNAKYTPAHLHFGIYTIAGAIDPFPFVNKEVRSAPRFNARSLTTHLQLKAAAKTKARDLPLNDSSILIPLAVTGDYYIAERADGTIVQAPFSSVKTIKPEKHQAALAKKNEI